MDNREVLLVLDAGTSSIRATAFDDAGSILSFHQHALRTSRPQPGHAEMDPQHVLDAAGQVISRCLADCRNNGWQPTALGLSVQRSSFLLWDAAQDQPLSPVLTWQDHRADTVLDRYHPHDDLIRGITGLNLAPYYGAPKLAWLMRHDPQLAGGLAAGAIKFIPLQSLLIRRLTGRLLMDETIAGRTLLFDIRERRWSDELLALFQTPAACLPEVVPSQSDFGTFEANGYRVPLLVAMGDQQAAMTGLGARQPGDAAINFGTSGSVLLHTGSTPRPTGGLLANAAYSSGAKVEYVLEGTINAVGALMHWLADREGRPDITHKWPELVADTTDLALVPGVNGLAAPYWRSDIATTFIPDESGYDLSHRIRAAMESVAFLASDILVAMFEGQSPLPLKELHCGGGMARPPLLQFQADLLQHSLVLHRTREATARGVALRLAEALEWDEFGGHRSGGQRFEPQLDRATSNAHLKRWRQAIKKILSS